MSVLENTLGLVAQGLVIAAAGEVERAILNRQIDQRLQLLARAGKLHGAGLEDLSKDMLNQIEKIDPNRPLLGFIGVDRPPVTLNAAPDEVVLASASGFLALVRPRATPPISVVSSAREDDEEEEEEESPSRQSTSRKKTKSK